MDPSPEDDRKYHAVVSEKEAVMVGSNADLSTEAGKLLMEDVEFGQVESDALLLDDSSDRLYLREQSHLLKQKEEKALAEQKNMLESFREAALGAQKTASSFQLSAGTCKSAAQPVNLTVKVKKQSKKPVKKKKAVVEKVAKTTTSLCAYENSSDSD